MNALASRAQRRGNRGSGKADEDAGYSRPSRATCSRPRDGDVPIDPLSAIRVRIDPPDLIAGSDRDLRLDRRGTPFLRICNMVTQYWAARSRIGVSSLSKAQ